MATPDCAHALQGLEHGCRRSSARGRPRARRASAPWARPAARGRPPASGAAPPESRPAASDLRAARSGNMAYIAATRSARAVAAGSRRRAADCRRPTSPAKTFSVCGTKARPRRISVCGGRRGDRPAPSSATAPDDDRHQPGDRLDQRRFAGAVGAEHARRSRRSRHEAGAVHDRQARLVAGDELATREDRRARSCRGAAEIGVDHARIADAPRAARLRQSSRPCGHHQDAAAEPRHQVHVVLDDQEGDAASR